MQLELMKEALGSYLFEYLNIIQSAQANESVLKDEAITRKLNYFFKLNEMLATGVGRNYALMLDQLCDSMNKVYLYYAMEINAAVAQQGKNVLNFMTVKAMRMVKREVLKVYTRMLERCQELTVAQAQHILNNFIYPLGELLADFQQCIPECKDQ